MGTVVLDTLKGNWRPTLHHGTGHVEYAFGEYEQGNAHLVLSDGSTIHIHDRFKEGRVEVARRTVGTDIEFVIDAFGVVHSLVPRW